MKIAPTQPSFGATMWNKLNGGNSVIGPICPAHDFIPIASDGARYPRWCTKCGAVIKQVGSAPILPSFSQGQSR